MTPPYFSLGVTQNPKLFAGVLGFLFTDAYLAYRHFQKSTMKHCDFKITLANLLMRFQKEDRRPERLIAPAAETVPTPSIHCLVLMTKPQTDKEGNTRSFQRYQKYCYVCQHNPGKNPVKFKTSYHCQACVGPNGERYPLCSPNTGRNCFQLHVRDGLPKKRRFLFNAQ